MMKTRGIVTEAGIEVVMPGEGGSEVLTVARRASLRGPKTGEAVVRVEAAGVSFAEVQMLKGRYFNQPKFPVVPGYDLVGTVEEIGEGVDEGLLGKRVAALTETGAWADRVAIGAEKLATVPDGLDPADAVAVITNGVTAWQMVHRAAKVRFGQTVVVHGASGGVGTLLVQRWHAARAAREAGRGEGNRNRLGLQARDPAGPGRRPHRLQERRRAEEGARDRSRRSGRGVRPRGWIGAG